MFDWDEANIVHIALHSVAPNEVEEAIREPFAGWSLAKCGRVKYAIR
jgi:hypothetical protein